MTEKEINHGKQNIFVSMMSEFHTVRQYRYAAAKGGLVSGKENISVLSMASLTIQCNGIDRF